MQVLLCFLLHELRIIVNSPDCYHINKFEKTLFIMYKLSKYYYLKFSISNMNDLS